MQKTMIIGNLGRTPELRYTRSGQQVTDFSVAVNRRYKTKDGEQRDETTWFTVTCWINQAEFAANYLRKGDKVYVEGRVSIEQFTDSQTGNIRTNLAITAQEVENLSPRNRREGEEEEEFSNDPMDKLELDDDLEDDDADDADDTEDDEEPY